MLTNHSHILTYLLTYIHVLTYIHTWWLTVHVLTQNGPHLTHMIIITDSLKNINVTTKSLTLQIYSLHLYMHTHTHSVTLTKYHCHNQ